MDSPHQKLMERKKNTINTPIIIKKDEDEVDEVEVDEEEEFTKMFGVIKSNTKVTMTTNTMKKMRNRTISIITEMTEEVSLSEEVEAANNDKVITR